MAGNNLGYFGPEEAQLRSLALGGRDHFGGCQAGRFVLGIESDGAVKGSPSLQSHPYVAGNLRTHDLALLGRPGNNPYCHFRARTLAAEGLRERLVPVLRAPGRPFDHGRFMLVLEPADAPDPSAETGVRERLRHGTRSLPLHE